MFGIFWVDIGDTDITIRESVDLLASWGFQYHQWKSSLKKSETRTTIDLNWPSHEDTNMEVSYL